MLDAQRDLNNKFLNEVTSLSNQSVLCSYNNTQISLPTLTLMNVPSLSFNKIKFEMSLECVQRFQDTFKVRMSGKSSKLKDIDISLEAGETAKPIGILKLYNTLGELVNISQKEDQPQREDRPILLKKSAES
jgi:hypothetical protein